MMLKFVFLLALGAQFINAKFSFDNYSLYRILPKNIQQIELLRELESSDSRFDFWSDLGPSVDFVSVLTSPQDKDALETFLKSNDLSFEITQSNIQQAFDNQIQGSYTRSNLRTMNLTEYHDLTSIYSWLDDLAATYDSVSVISAGQSYENRDIKGIKISNGEDKRAIFIEAGIHAREWVSPATACYIINALLTSNDPDVVAAANDFDWYIFPVTNPDGYVWTFTDFRMWRKNRRPFGTDVGVDLNRNWDSNWMEKGSSLNPASDIHAGTEPFSEPETRNLAAFIETVANDLDIYLSFHSFSQILLLPFGNTTTPYANYHEALNVGRRAMGALSVKYGTLYTSGNVAEAIYECTGTSVDWVKDNFPVPLAFVYEFRDRGQFGFALPADQIVPNAEETLDSILEIIHQGRRYGVLASSAHGVIGSFAVILAMVLTRFVL